MPLPTHLYEKREGAFGEAGTCNSVAVITGENSKEASVLIPVDAKTDETIHIIFEVSDSGTPALTRYQRVVITVK